MEVDGKKQPNHVHRRDGDLLGLVGIWQGGEDGEERVAIITCDPNAVMQPIHRRTPAILWIEDEAERLETQLAEAPGPIHLLGPRSEEELQLWPVTRAMNRTGHDRPDRVAPLMGR